MEMEMGKKKKKSVCSEDKNKDRMPPQTWEGKKKKKVDKWNI